MSASELVLAANAYTLIRRYEQRYSLDELNFTMRQRIRQANFKTLVSGAVMRHYSDCFREWYKLTRGRGYARAYDQVVYKSTDSQLDDWQCEGVVSREALALCGLPIFDEVTA